MTLGRATKLSWLVRPDPSAEMTSVTGRERGWAGARGYRRRWGILGSLGCVPSERSRNGNRASKSLGSPLMKRC